MTLKFWTSSDRRRTRTDDKTRTQPMADARTIQVAANARSLRGTWRGRQSVRNKSHRYHRARRPKRRRVSPTNVSSSGPVFFPPRARFHRFSLVVTFLRMVSKRDRGGVRIASRLRQSDELRATRLGQPPAAHFGTLKQKTAPSFPAHFCVLNRLGVYFFF